LKETWERARKVYKLLGAEENLQYFIGPTDHGYSIENRETMYSFFAQHAQLDSATKESEALEIFPAKDLNCTPTGQLMSSYKEYFTLHQILEADAKRMAAERKTLSNAELKSELKKALKLPENIEVPYSRQMPPIAWPSVPPERAVFSRFGLEGEPGLFTTLKINSARAYRHFPEMEKLTIYLPHLDSAQELLKLDRDADEFYAGLDYRNIGESLALTGSFGAEYRKFNMIHNQDYHYDGIELMFGSSMVGRRVLDILRAIEFVKANGVKQLHLIARGQGVIPGTIAALLSDKVESLTLYDAPANCMDMVQKRITRWPQSCMVPGLLKFTDLPEIYAAVKAEKELNIINVVNEPVLEV